MKVLDTTFLIDLLNGKREAESIAEGEGEIFTTQVNMYEVIRGLFWRNISPSRVARVMHLFGNIKVLPLNDPSIVKSAEISSELIKAGKKISDSDCLIAGIALSNGINTIVTDNVSHFSRIRGLKVETY